MSTSLGTIAINSGLQVTFSAPSDGLKGIVIGNESGLTCIITMESGGVQKTLYPSTVDWFDVRRGFTGTIRINPSTVLNNVSTFPSSSLVLDAIGINDPETASQYPISLNRNTNIGNSVNTLGGSANSIVNDNNIAGTSIIEATVTGDGNSAVQLSNDAVFVLGDTLHKGSLTTLGPSTLANIIKVVDLNAATFQHTHGADIVFQSPAGFEIFRCVNNGNIQIVAAILFQVGSLARISKFTAAVTTVSTFFNHGLGVVPDLVLAIPNGAAGTSTRTFEYENATMTSTQVKLTAGSSFNLDCLAIAF